MRLFALRKALALHEEDVAELDVAERRTCNDNALSSTMGKLPVELIVKIFGLSISSAQTTPTVLMSICHRWFDIVTGPPGNSLWTVVNIRIAGSDLRVASSRLQTYIRRSQPLPLSIRCNCDSTASKSDVDLIAALITPIAERWKTLMINEPHTSPDRWMPLPHATSLQSLRVFGESWSSEHSLVMNKTPSLRKLQFKISRTASRVPTHHLLDIAKFCPNLSVLTLDIPVLPCDVRAALPNLQFLQEFYWIARELEEEVHEEPEKSAKLSLPKLRTLSLAGYHVVDVLRDLTAPDLRTLSLKLGPGEKSEGHRATFVSWFAWRNPRFPSLQTLYYDVTSVMSWSQDVRHALCHPQLETVHFGLWESLTSISEMMTALGQQILVHIKSMTESPLFHQLKRWNMTYYRFSGLPHETVHIAGVVRSLESVLSYQTILHSGSSWTPFCIGIPPQLVEESDDLREMVLREERLVVSDTPHPKPWLPED